MKELARKGNISIEEIISEKDMVTLVIEDVRFRKVACYLTLVELSDLKDCISQVTAKKWKKDGSLFVCPNCEYFIIPAGYIREKCFCENCGLKLEGVEE